MRTNCLWSAAVLSLALAGCTATTGGAVDLASADADCVNDPVACPNGCLIDADCKNSQLPRCEPSVHRCVACLPTNDNCPSGQVCHLVNNTLSCLSTCSSSEDCVKLGGGSSCCSSICVPLGEDVQNCGACNNACAPVNNGDPGCIEGHCIIGSCRPGFEDCDKSPDDGCETPVGSDPLNCGTCGMVCQPFKNGIPSCGNGMCAAACAPSYADCNARVEDGCEIDITFDINNCGACGKSCTAPANATPSCDQGACGFRCKPGFSDCDGNRNNGCEISVNGDASNCGHCGNVCPTRLNSSGPTCTNGLCGNSCIQSFGDCDGNPANGCESNNLTDLNNCGGCGAVCSNKNAKNVCAQGVCTLTCNAGYFDCNMDSKDGCEAQVERDPKNCGGCGNQCPVNLPGCQKGMCSMQVCGNDCWGADGCMTAAGHCVRFTCRAGNSGASFCNGCGGWHDVTYDQWMKQGYCPDVIATYRLNNQTQTKCGAVNLVCCNGAANCGGGDNAWHFFNTNDNNNYFTGPCLGCANDVNCTFWNNVDNSTYTRITICER